ncbi:MAG: EF2563 family selenium-dependent molybdenum hydroxylase system protein [Planctomycetes bacterium]|nr:EF2563 family selenium-dependent molybdenum hydroxylase system protein [Planctomycetota bacterium]
MADDDAVVVVRGGGDIATGTVQKFFRAGFRVAILETDRPTTIRRSVALGTAVYDGAARVEDMTARRVDGADGCAGVWARGEIPVLVDPEMSCLAALRPAGLVDAVLAKRNLGLRAGLADVVIALGPGFTAPTDADAVVETMRGHGLGRVIFSGSAQPNTGLPAAIGGRGAERVLRAPAAGTVRHHRAIGSAVAAGETILSVNGVAVAAAFPGLVRGLIREGLTVPAGMKVADVDPRLDSDWRSISDKARCIGGGALEAYLFLRRRKKQHA